MGGLAAFEDEAPDLEKVLEVDKRQAGPYAVGAECTEVLKVDLYIRPPTSGGSTAHANHNHNTL